eukprot:7733831-Heterocapsa_arctica.AAC.1
MLCKRPAFCKESNGDSEDAENLQILSTTCKHLQRPSKPNSPGLESRPDSAKAAATRLFPAAVVERSPSARRARRSFEGTNVCEVFNTSVWKAGPRP